MRLTVGPSWNWADGVRWRCGDSHEPLASERMEFVCLRRRISHHTLHYGVFANADAQPSLSGSPQLTLTYGHTSVSARVARK